MTCIGCGIDLINVCIVTTSTVQYRRAFIFHQFVGLMMGGSDCSETSCSAQPVGAKVGALEANACVKMMSHVPWTTLSQFKPSGIIIFSMSWCSGKKKMY